MSEVMARTVRDEQTGKMVTASPAETGGAVNTVREYVTSDTGERPPFRRFIENPRTYGDAISSIVTKTCDVIIYDPETGRILVGNRGREPHPADWVIGGRKFAGHSDIETAAHNTERELGKGIAAMVPSRIQPVGTQYDVIWDTRDQPATYNEAGDLVTGVHQSVTLFALPVSEVEFDALAEPNEEYRHLRWVDPCEIIDAPAGTYHPAYVDMVFDTLERVITMPEGQPALR